MPDNEPSSPTTVIGEEENFPNNSKLLALLAELTEQLEHAESFIRYLQAELDYQKQEYSDHQFKSEYEVIRFRHLLACLETELEEKKQKNIDLALELDQVENQLRVFHITFDTVCRQRNDAWQRLGEVSYLLEQEEIKNQIVYDTLNSVVFERDILVKKYVLAKGKIERRERRLRELSEKLTTEGELVDIQQRRINNLSEQVNKLNSKNNRKQKQIIQLVQQLAKEQNKNKDLVKLINKLEKKVKELAKIRSNKKHNRQRINNLNQKLEKLTNENIVLQTENNSLKIQLTYYEDQDPKLRETIQHLQTHTCSPCSLPHLPAPHVCPIVQQINCSHADYDSLKAKLAEKESIIQQQVARIRELENKPPIVETKIIEKIKEAEKEKLVEKLTNVLHGESLEQIIEIDLNNLEKELGIKLSEEVKKQIQKIDSYRELSLLRNNEINKYLEKGRRNTIVSQPTKEIKSFKNERIIWIILLVISLAAIGSLLTKLSSSKKVRGSK